MNNPKISIVTPTFNSESYIKECIESILAQKYDNYEHIIIDGGSTDSTLSIIDTYRSQYNDKLIVISEPDNGMYDALNKGFSIATGDIYTWINSDDFLLPWALDTMCRVMKDRNVCWCINGLTTLCNESHDVFFAKHLTGIRAFSKRLIKKGFYDGRHLPFIQQEGSFWRKEVWEKAGGLDGNKKLAGDYWLWRSFAKYYQPYSVNTSLAAFRRRSGQLSENMSAYYGEMPKCPKLIKFFYGLRIAIVVTWLLYERPNKKYIIDISNINAFGDIDSK